MSQLRLTVSSAATVTKWRNTLDGAYTKEKLLNIIMSLQPMFADHTVTLGTRNLSDEFSLLLRKKTATPKGTLVDFLANILANEDNRIIVWDSFPDALKAVWQKLARNVFLSANDIRRLAGRPIPIPPTSRWGYTMRADTEDIADLVAWLAMMRTWDSQDYFYLPASIALSIPALKREPVEHFIVSSLPEADGGLSTFNAEAETLSLLPVLRNLWDNGMIEVGKSRVAVSSVNKAVKMLQATEFFPEADEKTDRTWRTALLVNAYAMHRQSSGNSHSHLAVHTTTLKAIFTGIVNAPSRDARFLLAMLFTKLSSSVSWGLNLGRLIKNVVRVLSRDASTDRWLLKDGFFDQISRDPGGTQDMLLFMPEHTLGCNTSNTHSDTLLRPDTLIPQAGEAMLLAVLSLFASLGFLEIAHTGSSPEPLSPSPMSSLYAMRLTPLGRYVMDIDPAYTPPATTAERLFELDPDHLIIRALGDTNPYEGLLKEFASPIGSRRYIVTPESFLARCDKLGDIIGKIQFFRQTVTKELPPIWEEFFKRMQHAPEGVVPDYSGTRVYNIDPADKYLIDVITTDSALRSLVSRAEGYRLLVDPDNIAKFETRMRHFGYIV